VARANKRVIFERCSPKSRAAFGRCLGAGAHYPNHFFLLTMARRRRAIAGLLNKEIGAELCVIQAAT
jgi:hypothetical protein